MDLNFKLPESYIEDFKALRNDIKELKENFQPKEPAEYLTKQEVADLLKVTLSSVHNWTKRGILIAFQIGGRIYYKRSDVEAAIIKLER